MAKINQTTSKSKKEVVPQVTPVVNGWSTVFKQPNEAEASTPETEPEVKQKREIFKTPPAKQTGKLTRKADSNAPASDKRTFIIEDDLMEKIYLIKYWSRCDTLSEIVNDAFRLKIEKYESENGILYPPQQ